MTMALEAQDVALAGRLEPTSLELAHGTLTGLIGPNGSGKTSLLHALAGIGRAEGRVTIAGLDLRRVAAAARPRLIGFVPARRDIRWPLRPTDLIALGGGSQEEIAAIVAELELEPFANRPVSQLSTGERSRVMLARALAPRPRVLLLDEPTANLDPLWQIRLMQLLRQRARAGGASVLVVLHDIDSAARWSDRLLVMADGRLVADGAADVVLGGPVIADVFGVRKRAGRWVPAVSAPAGRRSSR